MHPNRSGNRKKNWYRKIAQHRKELATLAEEERTILNQIDQNQAGQRLQQLEKSKQELEEKKNTASIRLEEFTKWCGTLHLPETTVPDESAYQRIKKENQRKLLALNTEQRLNAEDEYAAKRKRILLMAEKRDR